MKIRFAFVAVVVCILLVVSPGLAKESITLVWEPDPERVEVFAVLDSEWVGKPAGYELKKVMGDGIDLVENGDGYFQIIEKDGQWVVKTDTAQRLNFLYFRVNKDLVHDLSRDAVVQIDIEFYDSSDENEMWEPFTMQFDGEDGAYSQTEIWIAGEQSDEWRRQTFDLLGARFTGRQNRASDFRILVPAIFKFPDYTSFYIRRVEVRISD